MCPMWLINPCPFFSTLQAYIRSHITQAIYVLDFLKACKAAPDEWAAVERLQEVYSRLHKQVCTYIRT